MENNLPKLWEFFIKILRVENWNIKTKFFKPWPHPIFLLLFTQPRLPTRVSRDYPSTPYPPPPIPNLPLSKLTSIYVINSYLSSSMGHPFFRIIHERFERLSELRDSCLIALHVEMRMRLHHYVVPAFHQVLLAGCWYID